MAGEPWPLVTALTASGIDLDEVREAAPLVDPATVMVRRAPRVMRIGWPKGVVAVTWPWWGVFVHPDTFDRPADRLGRLMVHELYHVQQWRAEGAFMMALRYATDYLRGRFGGASHTESYRGVRYEVEARAVTDRITGRTAGPS